MKKFGWLALMVLVLLLITGCKHNLQTPYVESMEAYELALDADVKAGHYKLDALSAESYKAFKKADKDARALLGPKEVK